MHGDLVLACSDPLAEGQKGQGLLTVLVLAQVLITEVGVEYLGRFGG